MTYLWAYTDGVGSAPAPRPLILPTSYDVDLWDDNREHVRKHERMAATTNSREYGRLRMMVEHCVAWWDDYYRECKQLTCGRPHGPRQPNVRLDGNHGRVIEWGGGWQPLQQPYGSWKSHRQAQYKGSARV